MDLVERFVPFVPFATYDDLVLDDDGAPTNLPWWQDITAIVTEWDSCDGASPEPCPLGGACHEVLTAGLPDAHSMWACLIVHKQRDYQYPDVRRSVMERGFVRPLSVDRYVAWNDGAVLWEFGDGHHRLAAAIELGYTHVPVHLCIGGCSHRAEGLASHDWRRYLEGNTP